MFPMTFLASPANPLRLWSQVARIAIESQMVIGIRMAGMMGVVAQSPGEPFRMIGEKQAAASESLFAFAQAAGRGASPDRVISAALRPYGKRTRANSRRLTHQR
ncbi:antibiotic ABC transporter [Paracoccus caeni]|uniref:Antibiotic ABC transporter n=1 Tax=Paracoccus caeni TaxID=657651 RepID=A0A934SH39_9RHOB|nr:antibiotic ABC transporter [Paracoccus caeni]MBK4215287.1 antibiotic ABC transporter [Paracoccus caeni]